MSLSVAPIGFMTGINWVKYGLQIMDNIPQAIQQTMLSLETGEGIATAFTVVPPILGLVLIISSIAMSYYGYKAKHLFV